MFNNEVFINKPQTMAYKVTIGNGMNKTTKVPND